MFSLFHDLEEVGASLDPLIQRYLPIAIATCLELFYRQVGQRLFNASAHMHTPVNISITLARLDEFRRVLGLFTQADLFRHNRRVQGVDDIRSIQEELGMESVFKGDPRLLDVSHQMFGVRNNNAHGAGAGRYDVRLFLWALRRHLEKVLGQLPPMRAVFWLIGAGRADRRGDRDAALGLCRRAAEEADAAAAAGAARDTAVGLDCLLSGMRPQATAGDRF